MDFRDKTMTQSLPLCDTVDRESHPKWGGNQLCSEEWMRIRNLNVDAKTTDKCGETEVSFN